MAKRTALFGHDPESVIARTMSAGARERSASRQREFRAFAANATDSQLEAIIQKEYDAGQYDDDRMDDYYEAVKEAVSRGWYIVKNRRIG